MRRKACILLMTLMLVLLFGCDDSLRLIIPAEEEKFYSPKELVAVFHTYQDSFSEVVEIVLENEALEQMMINSREGTVSIWTVTKRDCFSEEDWDKIVDLFRETGLSRIERNNKGGKETIRFQFIKNNDTTTLYYFREENEINIRYNTQFDTYVEKIDDEWWVGFAPSPY